MMEETNRNPMLSSYIEETEYYKTAYYLGSSLYRNGKSIPARDLWTFVASQPGAGEWRGRAQSQLRSPRIEPIVERP
jgi:hypothetical protein